MNLKIRVGVSNRHIHLSESDYKFLFGEIPFGVKNYLTQDGEFASNFKVTLKTSKNEIKDVRVIGPLRNRTQVEISKTDAYFLGINPPVRMSGDLDGAEDILIVYGDKELECKEACILAHRHIHVNNTDAKELGFYDGKSVSIVSNGDRCAVLNNVLIKVKDSYNLELHLDTDEANALGLKNGDIVELKGEE